MREPISGGISCGHFWIILNGQKDMLSVSAAIRNRLTLIRMRRVLDFGE